MSWRFGLHWNKTFLWTKHAPKEVDVRVPIYPCSHLTLSDGEGDGNFTVGLYLIVTTVESADELKPVGHISERRNITIGKAHRPQGAM